jgi:hypothetical protein
MEVISQVAFRTSAFPADCKLEEPSPVLRPSSERHSTLTGMGKKLSTGTEHYHLGWITVGSFSGIYT